jgi:hypothetical protein
LSWIRHLLPIFRTGLLFGLIGMPLGAIIFLAGFGIVWGKPLAAFGILGKPGLAAGLTAFFGGIPAIATGALAVFLRKRVQSFPPFAFVVTMVGAVVTAVYLSIVVIVLGGFRWRPEIFLLAGGITATGGVAAFCCAFLLCRSRPSR